MAVTVRKGRKDDFNFISDAVRDILRICFREKEQGPPIEGAEETYDKILADPEHNEVLIAETNGKRVGTALVTIQPIVTFGGSAAEIQDLYVDPSARKLGVGSALIKEIVNIAKERKLKGVYLIQPKQGTELDEERNLFYKRQGLTVGGFCRRMRIE